MDLGWHEESKQRLDWHSFQPGERGMEGFTPFSEHCVLSLSQEEDDIRERR